MGNKTRLMAGALGLGLFISSTGVATALSPRDFEGHWAQEGIENWLQKGWLRGDADGSVRPDHIMTRMEFITLVNRIFDLPEGDTRAVQTLPSSNRAPGDPVSRQEAAVIVGSLLMLEVGGTAILADFKDKEDIELWSRDMVGGMINKGMLKGYPDGTFRPRRGLTRAEAVAILRILEQTTGGPVILNEAQSFGGKDNQSMAQTGSLIVNASGVNIQNILVHTEVLLNAGAGSGEVTLRNVKVNGPVTIRGGGAVRFIDCDLQQVIVNNNMGMVSINSEGSTSIKQLSIQSDATLVESNTTGSGFTDVEIPDSTPSGVKIILRGVFERVKLNAKAPLLQLQQGMISELITSVNAKDSYVELQEGASVKKAVSDNEQEPVSGAAPLIPIVNGITVVSIPLEGFTNAAELDVDFTSMPIAVSKQTQTVHISWTEAPLSSFDLNSLVRRGERKRDFHPFDSKLKLTVSLDEMWGMERPFLNIIFRDASGKAVGYYTEQMNIAANRITKDNSLGTIKDGVKITLARKQGNMSHFIDVNGVFKSNSGSRVHYYSVTPKSLFKGTPDEFNVDPILLNSYPVLQNPVTSRTPRNGDQMLADYLDEEYILVFYDENYKAVSYYRGGWEASESELMEMASAQIKMLPAPQNLVLEDERKVESAEKLWHRLSEKQRAALQAEGSKLEQTRNKLNRIQYGGPFSGFPQVSRVKLDMEPFYEYAGGVSFDFSELPDSIVSKAKYFSWHLTKDDFTPKDWASLNKDDKKLVGTQTVFPMNVSEGTYKIAVILYDSGGKVLGYSYQQATAAYLRNP